MGEPAAAGFDVSVLGPGAIGGLLAALLSRGGASVLCLAGEDTSRVLAERGVSLRSARFGTFAAPVSAAGTLSGPVDVCLVAVKATDLERALERVPADALGHGIVVPFLNGIEHVPLLRAHYPPDQVVPATIRVAAARTEPGVIEQTSPFAAIELAPPAAAAAAADRLAGRLTDAGLDVALRADETTMLWSKLAFLAPLALLTTHEAAPIGAVRAHRNAELVAVAHEVCLVAAAAGADIDEPGVSALLETAPESMQSSMQRDAAEGRPLEIEAIGGAVLRAAARYRVGVPVTARLVDDLRARSF